MATETEKMVYEMICENTGRALCDSGDFYGRHYDRNSRRSIEDFINDPVITIRPKIHFGLLEPMFYSGRLELNETKSLFHHLVDALEYDKHMDTLFHRFVDQNAKAFYEYWDDNYEFSRYNYETHEMEYWTGPHGYGNFSWEKAMREFIRLATKDHRRNYSWNSWQFEGESFNGYTYIDENSLSQDFIYHSAGEFVFIQTHNGCDARGGLSLPHLFHLRDEYALFEYSRFTLSCANGHWWDFDGGYETTEQDMHLFHDDRHNGVPLIDGDDAEFLDVEGDYEQQLRQWKSEKRAWELSDPLPGMDKPDFAPAPELLAGKLLVKDGKIFCPVCGEELIAYAE